MKRLSRVDDPYLHIFQLQAFSDFMRTSSFPAFAGAYTGRLPIVPSVALTLGHSVHPYRKSITRICSGAVFSALCNPTNYDDVDAGTMLPSISLRRSPGSVNEMYLPFAPVAATSQGNALLKLLPTDLQSSSTSGKLHFATQCTRTASGTCINLHTHHYSYERISAVQPIVLSDQAQTLRC